MHFKQKNVRVSWCEIMTGLVSIMERCTKAPERFFPAAAAASGGGVDALSFFSDLFHPDPRPWLLMSRQI